MGPHHRRKFNGHDVQHASGTQSNERTGERGMRFLDPRDDGLREARGVRGEQAWGSWVGEECGEGGGGEGGEGQCCYAVSISSQLFWRILRG
jgi:hypothetical protein